MPATAQQLATLTSTAGGLNAETLEERILSVLAIMATGSFPDGTTPAAGIGGAGALPPETIFPSQLTGGPIAPVTTTCTMYFRNVGGVATVTSVNIGITAQSGNIGIAVYSSAGGLSPPVTLLATTGSIPCPATGIVNIPLGSTVRIDQTCYFAIAADNNVVHFTSNAASFAVSAYGAGSGYFSNGAFPPPANPAGASAMYGGAIWMSAQ